MYRTVYICVTYRISAWRSVFRISAQSQFYSLRRSLPFFPFYDHDLHLTSLCLLLLCCLSFFGITYRISYRIAAPLLPATATVRPLGTIATRQRRALAPMSAGARGQGFRFCCSSSGIWPASDLAWLVLHFEF